MSTDGSSAATKTLAEGQFASPDHLDPENLLATVEELRARLRAQDARHAKELTQFAYAASHQLREPLRMIASYTQLLSRRDESSFDAEGREFMQYVLEGVQIMERLLGDLLSYSLQLRPLGKPPSPVAADAALRGVLLSLEKQIRESGAQITHDALPIVQSDFTHLSQVFSQLILNSITFSGTEPPRIHIFSTETEDETTFAIQDHGLGIDPRYHQEVFNAFKRLHGREYPGTGLGLAISKRIVEQYGGRIWVESEPGQGALFRFTLPK